MSTHNHTNSSCRIQSRAINAPGWLCLLLAVWPALVPINSHAGLVGRWVADDWAGGTNNWVDRVAGQIATVASPTNSPTKTPGVFPQTGLVFDGTNDYFSVAAAQNPIVGKTSITIAAYILTTNGASGLDDFYWEYPGPVNGESPGFTPNDWGLTYDAAGNARAFFNAEITPSPAVSLTNGQPHTMILTWQDPSFFPGQGVARLYVDGILAASTGPTDGGNGIVTNGFVIGANTIPTHPVYGRFFKGAIGELRFYDSVEDPAALHTNITGLLVTTTADSGTGSLRQTVANATANETIRFHPNLSGQTIVLSTGQILIDKNLTLDASDLPGGMSIHGNLSSRGFEVGLGSTATMQGLKIVSGRATNPAGLGRWGGGIFNQGNLTLRRCELTGNAATLSGGAIYSQNGNLTIEESTLSFNEALGGSGGGVVLGGGSNTVTSSTFWSNTANSSGGGIFNLDAVLTVRNSTFYLNSAGVAGGGIINEGGSIGTNQVITIVNSTFTVNSAQAGSGLYNSRVLNLENSIVAGNFSAATGGTDIYQAAGIVNNLGVNLIGNNDTVTNEFPAGPLVGTITSPLNPRLAPLADYGGPTQTTPPLPHSPAVDAAGSGATNDQRSVARPQGAGFDLGAVEYLQTVVTTAADEANVNPGTGLSLREALVRPFASFITFDPAVFNGAPADTILLTNGQLTIERSIQIDGSGLYGGVIISGNNTSRVFEVASGANLTLDTLTVTGGRSANGASGATGPPGDDSHPGGTGGLGGAGQDGGGILNHGLLTLNGVTVSGNKAGNGGLGGAGGSGVVQGSGGTGGAGGRGGGIYNSETGSLFIENSTITGNTSGAGGNGGAGTTKGDGGNGGNGGGIGNDWQLVMNQVTVTDNTAGNAGTGQFGLGSHGTGGGISSSGTLYPQSILVALNTAPGGQPDVSGSASSTVGVSFIGNPSGASGFGTPGVNYFSGDPMLSPQGYYGGATMTRPPLPGSPVIDRYGGGLATDQRGQARPQGGGGDIGAVEGPFIPAGPVRLAGPTPVGNGAVHLTFTNFSGGFFTVLATSDPVLPKNLWLNVGLAVESPPGSGQFHFIDPQGTKSPRRFYRAKSP